MSQDVKFDNAKAKAVYSVDRLRDKFPAALKIEDVVDYAFSVADREDAFTLGAFKRIMKSHGQVTVDEKNATYRYKPPYAIRSPEALIAYFQNQTHTRSLSVEQLKKGWPDCDAAIDKLEKQHKLIVIRTKKDNAPRHIWADDPALFAKVDQEFVDLWNGIELPPKDDIIRYLEKTGRVPAGQVAAPRTAVQAKAKVKKSRQSTKQTNKHMAGLFKDYSGLRQKGK